MVRRRAGEIRLLALLVAVWTQPMRCAGAAFRWLQLKYDSSESYVLKLVFFLLLVPCFKASELCFKCLYCLQRRRIALLNGSDLFPEIVDGRIPFVRVIHTLKRAQDIERGFERAKAR